MIRSKKEQRNLCDAYKSNDLRKIKKEVCAPAPMEGEQNPAWSEEDKNMHDFALRAIRLCKQYAINNQTNGYSKLPDIPQKYEELYQWLKNGYTWKPSDEQIRPLEYAIDYFRRKKNDTTYLESLYQDLMKLREE